MLGKYKAVLALLLLIILVPLTLLMTLGLWVPTLAGIWLPLGTRIALDESPRITRKGLIIPISVIWWEIVSLRISPTPAFHIPAAGY
ncbi:hypothetical protein ACVXHA_14290 [Escherichia coli]